MSARALAVSVVLSVGAVIGAAALPAAAVCDPYSSTCTTPPATPSSVAPSTATTEPTTPGGGGGLGEGAGGEGDLAFTGGEVALLTVLGAGALAGGGALVVAGRRRRVVS